MVAQISKPVQTEAEVKPHRAIYVSQDVYDSLQGAIEELTEMFAEEGSDHAQVDIAEALFSWFENTIEDLASDAVFHVAEGGSPHALNRGAFDRALARQRVKRLKQEVAA